ncbi:MAG: Sensor protein [Burkholderia sp.]|jgi:two-component system, NarL family, nitrate/nitrite sensor histidine kinase NarX
MHSFLAWLRGSLARPFLLYFGAVAALLVICAVPAIALIELSTGSGSAINVSGSMRMQSYKLALAVADPYETQEERRRETQQAVRDFSSKLSSPGLLSGFKQRPDDPAYPQYTKLKERFERNVAPLAEASIADEDARKRFLAQVPDFVGEVDRFVQTLENSLNRRLAALKWMLAAILVGLASGTFLIVRYLRRRLFTPLGEIGRAAHAVRRGRFDVRAPVRSHDEIGRVAEAFNYMVEELGGFYGRLESEVEKKTADLARRNGLLQLLSKVGRAVSAGDRLEAKGLSGVLDEACRLMGAASACVTVGDESARYVLSKSAAWQDGDERLARAFPFAVKGESAGGALQIRFEGEEAGGWQSDVASALAQTIGADITRAVRQLDGRRLAVLEERSTIARELHDSIAQTLSYCRIQVHRLKFFLGRSGPDKDVQGAIDELSEGVNTAYRQIREVLTAFRMQPSSKTLSGAVDETVEEFRNRTGIAISVENALTGLELSPNSHVHIIYILREALVNVEKHAHAKHVAVRLLRLADGSAVLDVTDDGQGIDENAAKANHFGLSIMKERAEALGGSLSVSRVSPEGGTRVRLTLPAAPGPAEKKA